MLRLHPFRWHRPDTVEEAVALLETHGDEALPIAGGTDLVPNMKHRLFTPGHLVSLTGIDELRGIAESGEGIRIGAAETLDTVASTPTIKGRLGSLAEACRLISGPQLRRVGTLGGNLCLDTRCTYYNQTWFWRKSLGFCLKKDGDVCHVVKGGTRCVAAHSADTPPVLITLGAELEIAGREGRRRVPVADFFTSDGIWNRRMETTEILVAVYVPWQRQGRRLAFEKLRPRAAIDFPILNLAIAVDVDGDDRVSGLDMVASAMGAYPRRIGKVEEAAVGNRLTPAVIDSIARHAYRQCHPLANIAIDREWRRAMVPVLVRRGLGRIAGSPERAPTRP